MKERLRVVKCPQRHRKNKEATEAQVKEAAGTKLKKVDGDFPACMRHEKDNNDDNTRKNEDLKGKGGGRLKHFNVDGDVPLCLRNFDEENKDGSSSRKNSKEWMVSGSSTSNSMKDGRK